MAVPASTRILQTGEWVIDVFPYDDFVNRHLLARKNIRVIALLF
jgi:hypothetical protein